MIHAHVAARSQTDFPAPRDSRQERPRRPRVSRWSFGRAQGGGLREGKNINGIGGISMLSPEQPPLCGRTPGEQLPGRATDGAAGAMERDARDKPARGWQGGRSVSATSRRPNMTRGSQGLGNKACLIRRSSTSGEGGILSGLFSTVSDFLRFLTQCLCLSTTCDRWLVLRQSGPFWAKSGRFSKVSAKCYGAMPERGGLSARARGAALGIAIVPPTAVKGGAS